MNIISYELDFLPKSIWHHIDATAEAKANIVYLQEVGYFFTGENYYTKRQGLDSFLVKVVVSGGGILEYGGHTERVNAGQFFWIDCMNYQHYYTDPKEGHWDVIWVHFSGSPSRAYYEAFRKLSGGSAVGKLPAGSPVYKILDVLLNRFPSTEEKQNFFEADLHNSGILTQLMIACVSAVGSGGESVHMPTGVQDIRKFLDANYDQKITLEDLSNKFNLDPYYLQKLFKRYTGQSPTQYIIHLRMARAKTLLRSTTQSVSEIAYAVGIDNVSHFTRQFKKSEGMSPVQYRKFWPII